MLKSLQARLQQYMNCELPNDQAGCRKGRGIRDQIANSHWIIGKTRVPEIIYFCFTDYAKAFDCADHNKLWKILKEMGIPDHLICLLRNSLDRILKSRDITLPTKVCLVKAMVFPVVMYGCEGWAVKKVECKELMCLYCGVGEDS